VEFAVFHPKARDAIRDFPEDVRREFGKVIFDLQKGEKLAMPLSTDGFGWVGCGGIAQGPSRRASSFLLHPVG
jgi:phage-related protein